MEEKMERLAREAGFSYWAPLEPERVQLREEVRQMCAVNSCGQYGKRWSCPPGCGGLEDCRERLKGFSRGLLVQTVGEIEDSFDFEAMMEIEQRHKEQFGKLTALLGQEGMDFLALGAGCCTKCSQCTYPDAPCRFPKEMVSSMEAYGILVSQVCKDSGLPYYYGTTKIAYTSCVFCR